MSQITQQQWDFEVQKGGGSFHQSWGWGEFKRLQGWRVERFHVRDANGTGMAQVLFSRHGPVGSATLQRGPVLRGDPRIVLPGLFGKIHQYCVKSHTYKLNVEPLASHPFTGECTGRSWTPAHQRFTPERTVIVQLTDDEALVRQMHSAKRREIRKAERQGITILERQNISEPGMHFHRLMRDTAERNQFPIHGANYYETFLSIVGTDAAQLFAVIDGEIVAGLIAARFGEQAIFMFGGSSTSGRIPGATTYLQLHAMRWARERGCTSYDLWGIPPVVPAAASQSIDQPIRSTGEDKSGLYRFKVELGGDIVSLPPSFDVHYHPAISWVARTAQRLSHRLPGS